MIEDLKIELIYQCDREDGISRNGKIPWNNPHAISMFEKLTKGHFVIMGRKTWDNLSVLSKPLADRLNIVLTRDPNNVEDYELYSDKVEFIDCLEHGFEFVRIFGNDETKAFVIGGGEVFSEVLKNHENMIDSYHEIHLVGDYECDKYLPNINVDEFDCVEVQNLSEDATYLQWLRKDSQESEVCDS